ncbi:MAG: MipA/OmpV family protein [Campylobacterales bacterium]|nr:MipA/OmpV family protein [Campylobacterales bacterium]
MRAQEFGYMAAVRVASVPYRVDHPSSVMVSYLPLLWFEGEQLYLRGLSGGMHLWQDAALELNLLARWRFVDMPRSDPHYFSNDRIDTGIGLRYEQEGKSLELALLHDGSERFYEELRIAYAWGDARYHSELAATLQHRSASFNSYYYGLGQSIGDSMYGAAEYTVRYQVKRPFSLYAALKAEHHGLSEAHLNTEPSLSMITGVQWSEFRGSPSAKSYLQSGIGFATRGSFSELMTLSAHSDPHHHVLVSLFYGHPLSDSIADLDAALYWHSGIALHQASSDQSQAIEGVCALKLFFKPHSQWRIGIASGLSYISEPTYVERWANEKDGYTRTSRFMNHLDVSIERSIDRSLSLGYGVFHRSGIFESVQSFGQIKGGSNYHHFYVKFFL